MLKFFLFGSILVAVVALACGSDSNGEPEANGPEADRPVATPVGTPTAPEQAYLDELENALMLIVQNFEHFGEVIGAVYPTRGALFGALEEAGAGTAFDDGLAALEALDPPERFRVEHDLAVDGLRELQQVDREVGQAVIDNDLVAFALANVRLAKVTVETTLQHSAAFCLARFDAGNLCERPDFSSSGEYGEALYSLFSRIQSDVIPALSAQFPALNDEESLELFNVLAPGALDILEQSEEDLRALGPPEGLEADHDRLVLYLGDLVQIATERQQAVDAGDLDTARAQIGQLFETFCTAVGEISTAILPFVIVHFGASESDCGGQVPGPPS